MKHIKIGTLIIVLFISTIIGCIGVTNIYHPSDPQTGTVRAGKLNVFTSLTLSPNDITEGQSWTLSGKLSNGQADAIITLKEGDIIIGSPHTNALGEFSYTFTPAFVGPNDEVHTYVAYPP